MAIFGTAVITAALCLSPVRWDLKTIGRVLPRATEGLDLSDRHVLFVSARDDWRDAHLARYGLDLLTFPDGSAKWMALSEGIEPGGFQPEYSIDDTGSIAKFESGAWRPVTEAERRNLWALVPVASSQQTRRRLVDRWPDSQFRVETVHIVGPAHERSFWEEPRWRASPEGIARLFGVLLLPMAALIWAVRRKRTGSPLASLELTLIIPAILAGHVFLVYGLGFLTSNSMAFAIGLEAMMGMGLAIVVGKRDGLQRIIPVSFVDTSKCFRQAIPWIFGILVFVTIVTLRLDFDGDLYTHWLPSARMHHLLGHHDPEILATRYGNAHEATYPPAFPILISTLMWIAGMSGRASFALGDTSHVAIFLYRGLIASVLLSFLGAVTVAYRSLTGRLDCWEWLVPVVAIPLALPLFLGEPRAGEVFFTPMLGFASLALLVGGSFGRARFVRLGLAMAAFGAFTKNDALLVVPLIVLPWYVVFATPERNGARSRLLDLMVLVLAGIPVLIWRIEVAGAVDRINFMFEGVTLTVLATRAEELIRLLIHALEILFRTGHWVILLLALPAVTMYRVLQNGMRREVLLPLGIMLYSLGLPVLFLFSKSDPVEHMYVAYSRLLSHAILSAILYVSWVLLVDRISSDNSRILEDR